MIELVGQLFYLIIILFILSFSREFGRFLILLYLKVPGSKIKLNPFQFPHYIELYNGEKWIKSTEEDFLAAYYRYEPARRGGFALYSFPWVFESLVLFISYIFINTMVSTDLASYLIILSLIFTGAIFIYQLIIFWRTEEYRGDFIVLYVISPAAGVASVALYYIFRLILLVF